MARSDAFELYSGSAPLSPEQREKRELDDAKVLYEQGKQQFQEYRKLAARLYKTWSRLVNEGVTSSEEDKALIREYFTARGQRIKLEENEDERVTENSKLATSASARLDVTKNEDATGYTDVTIHLFKLLHLSNRTYTKIEEVEEIYSDTTLEEVGNRTKVLNDSLTVLQLRLETVKQLAKTQSEKAKA